MMKNTLKHLWSLAILILLCSSVLLLSDLSHRKPRMEAVSIQQEKPGVAKKTSKAKVAVSYFGEAEVSDLFLTGLDEGFRLAGYIEGENLELLKKHGSSEIAMLPQVTQSLVARDPDVLITASTPCLASAIQVVDSSLPIIFGLCTAPLEAGGGKSFTEHRPNVTGAVFTVPTPDLIQQIKTVFPTIKKVGILYNPSESNSVKEINALQEMFAPLGISLVLGPVNNPSEILVAQRAVFQQEPGVFYLICDNTVVNGLKTIIRNAQKAGVPVVVDDDSMMGCGALLSQGPSPYLEGVRTAQIAGRVLKGENPALIPFAPSTQNPLTFDLEVAQQLNVVLTAELRKQIQKVYNFHKFYGHKAEIRLVQYADVHFAEEAAAGLMAGLKRAGLIEGEDFNFRSFSAQGDMATLSAIMSTVNADVPDLVMVISTPALQAALRMIDKNIPIVFTAVANGVKAGAGRSKTDHRPNVTGITTRSPFLKMARKIKQSLPNVQRVGTLFTPAEINSVLYCDLFAEALASEGVELVRVPVTSSAETVQSAGILCSKNIQAVAQISDNTSASGIGVIVKEAAKAGIPTFVFVSSQMKAGAAVCVARDFYDAGLEASAKALRILLGESPADIPFSNTVSEKMLINHEKAAHFGLEL